MPLLLLRLWVASDRHLRFCMSVGRQEIVAPPARC
jgi:hypothetical protein